MSAIVAQREKDPDSQLKHLRRVTSGGSEFSQPDIYIGALKTTFRHETNDGQYASALLTYQKLIDSNEKSYALDELGKMVGQIKALIEGDSRLSSQGELGPRRGGAGRKAP